MHEVSLLLNVAEMGGKTIEGTDITHVDEVVLEIGDLTGVIPAFMIDGYSYISDEYEFLKGSELIINQIKSRGICRDCSMEFAIVENEGICPSCGSVSKTVISGQEFIIKEIRIRE